MIKAYDVKIPNEKKYRNYASRQTDVLMFHSSDAKNCEIVMEKNTIEKARQLQSSYLTTIKRLKLNTAIKCIIRAGRVFLVKVEMEG